MKSKLFFAVVAVGMLMFTSCKKCEDCTAYLDGQSTGETQEYCGDDLDTAKESWNEENQTGWKCP